MKRNYWLWIIVAVIAILGGVFGGIAINSIEKDSFSSSILGPDIDLSGQKTIVVNNPRKVVVNQDLRLQELSNSLSASLIGVFKKNDKELNVMDSYYNFDKALATALPLTSDGWILLNQSSVSDLSFELAENYSKYVAILPFRNNTYEIDKVYLPQKSSPFILLHLSSVADLPVRDFLAPDYLSIGQMYIQQSFSGGLAVNYLANNILGSESRSSEPYNRKLSLVSISNKDLVNSFAFDLSGSLVAIVGGDGSWYLAHDFYPALKEFLRSGDLNSYKLGISYYDLSDFFRKDFNSKNPKRGAYIATVAKGSVAATAGFKVGDIVVSVNGIELDDGHDLAEILKPYKIGDKVLFAYLRNQELKDLNIILE